MADPAGEDLTYLVAAQRDQVAAGLGDMSAVLLAIAIGLTMTGQDEAGELIARAADDVTAAAKVLRGEPC